jgi:hypothetical protein
MARRKAKQGLVSKGAADPHWADAARKLVAGLIEAKRNPNSLTGRKLRRFVEHADSKEIASIRSTAVTQTAIFDAATLLHAMETGPEAVDPEPPVTAEEDSSLVELHWCCLCQQRAIVYGDSLGLDHLEYQGWAETPRGLVCDECSTPRSNLRS